MNIKDYTHGLSFDAHEYFGAHITENGVVFRVYAPHAAAVSILSECTGWREAEMKSLKNGVYESNIPGARCGMLYKYVVYSKRGVRREHCDPYGFAMERGYGRCSIICDNRAYLFSDDRWMSERSLNFDKPVNIYEMHIGSWKRKEPFLREWYNYGELAEPLIEYLHRYSYTHVEFLPLGEHPADGSMGYQCTGFFAPTSRYGSPSDLKKLVDCLHRAGIGVIFDFVSAHFAVDSYGLAMFDGSSLYEPAGKYRRSEWGSLLFDHGKGAVRSFLQSSAAYWAEEYHADGLRFDAVSHLIFRGGRWENGENADGLFYLRSINTGLQKRFPTMMLIAEDSTAYAGVTSPVSEGGLGFHYKWALGWTHDTLEFFQTPSVERPGKSRLLTFSGDYFGSERFLIPFSHDEVCGLNKALAGKMHGRKSDRMRQAKLMLMYQMMHPGKKLCFMGSELGMEKGWSVNAAIEHDIVSEPEHRTFSHFIRRLNRIGIENSALYEADYENWGFRWLRCDDDGDCFYALIRHSEVNHVAAVFNFSQESRSGFVVLPHIGTMQVILNSEWRGFGGSISAGAYGPEFNENGFRVFLPPCSGILLEINFI